MCANRATIETKYIDSRSMLGNINEKAAATATGNSIHGNTSHLVLLICDTINRHCNSERFKLITSIESDFLDYPDLIRLQESYAYIGEDCANGKINYSWILF